MKLRKRSLKVLFLLEGKIRGKMKVSIYDPGDKNGLKRKIEPRKNENLVKVGISMFVHGGGKTKTGKVQFGRTYERYAHKLSTISTLTIPKIMILGIVTSGKK